MTWKDYAKRLSPMVTLEFASEIIQGGSLLGTFYLASTGQYREATGAFAAFMVGTGVKYMARSYADNKRAELLEDNLTGNVPEAASIQATRTIVSLLDDNSLTETGREIKRDVLNRFGN